MIGQWLKGDSGDRQTRSVEIYRPGQAVEVVDNPERLSGETVLPGFVLELAPIW
jgi:Uma2 family endonuclease